MDSNKKRGLCDNDPDNCISSICPQTCSRYNLMCESMVLTVELKDGAVDKILHTDKSIEAAKRFVNESKPVGDIHFFVQSDIDPFKNCMTCRYRVRKGLESRPEEQIACWKIADRDGSDHRAFIQDGYCFVCDCYKKGKPE